MLLALPGRVDLPDCTLRPWSAADAAALRIALNASDAHLRTFTPWVVDGRVPGVSLADRLAQHAADFESGKEWVYGMFSADGAEVLGGCGLYPRVGPTAVEVGYWLAVGHTGRGLATRAAAALTRLAFVDPTIDQVEIHCDRRNTASARVPERLGYRIMEPPSGHAESNLVMWRLRRSEFVEQMSGDKSNGEGAGSVGAR
jgi:RimJ/RimL family protein N-acetyltransferase